jgi:hypothetical protein
LEFEKIKYDFTKPGTAAMPIDAVIPVFHTLIEAYRVIKVYIVLIEVYLVN